MKEFNDGYKQGIKERDYLLIQIEEVLNTPSEPIRQHDGLYLREKPYEEMIDKIKEIVEEVSK